jgi:exopolyphosphatase/guanosine-5'-triphosphate,3'-diphosphate pyrophosphatase
MAFYQGILIFLAKSHGLLVERRNARRDPDIEGLRIGHPGERSFTIKWREGWAELYPQSAHLLREEAMAWERTPWRVELA